MTAAEPATTSRRVRDWPVWAAPTTFRRYLFLVDAIAVVCWIFGFIALTFATSELTRLAILIALALSFEEGVRKAARLRLRLSAELHRDMTSVWFVAAAAVLPPAGAGLLVVVIFMYVWFRQQRPAGELLHRKLFNAATSLIACLAADVAFHQADDRVGIGSAVLAGAVGVVAAMAAYTTVNRLLVTFGLMILGVRGKALIGSADENLIEFATLCLGGLVGITLLHQPWLTPLVLAPMVSLQRGALVRQLEEAAATDAKTGMLNAIAWEYLAGRELARAAREGSELAVLIIDLDWFKKVNDRYGHLAGDAVLKAVGQLLTEELREYDSAGRFGGEEFVAVLPGVGDADALAVAERVRARISAARISDMITTLAPVGEHRLTVSIGVAVSPADGSELPELLHAADAALYAAKANGRNQVQLARRGTGDSAARVIA
jgi:diguanylate cyclase (GGDEF)-like protein